jgi:uncharacterized Zn finger protein (UPF0148 family)
MTYHHCSACSSAWVGQADGTGCPNCEGEATTSTPVDIAAFYLELRAIREIVEEATYKDRRGTRYVNTV